MGLKPEQFVNDVDEHLFCSICHEVLQDPHGCKEGHSFCKVCITEWLKTKQICPMDNTLLQVDKLMRNLIAHNMVQNLEVWCNPPKKDRLGTPYNNFYDAYGAKCQWKGKLQSLSRHRETCPFQNVRCPFKNCNKKMQRREFKDHDRICKWKTIQCNECNKQMVRFQLQDHITDECPEARIPCTNKCTTQAGYGQIQRIKRADLDNHLKNMCPKTILDCQFKEHGCSVRVERQHVDKHVQDNRDAHMMLLAKQCLSLTKQCSSLTRENNRLRDDLYHLKEDFYAQLSSSSSYDWTVSDFLNLSKNHSNGSRIDSPTFWLRGCRWQIALYPNGGHNATGFLSLYLKKVEDEFNPISDSRSNKEPEITFRITVISQEPGTDDVSHQGKSVFSRELNTWGFSEFMKVSDALLPSYCKNGSLMIKITVEPNKPQ